MHYSWGLQCDICIWHWAPMTNDKSVELWKAWNYSDSLPSLASASDDFRWTLDARTIEAGCLSCSKTVSSSTLRWTQMSVQLANLRLWICHVILRGVTRENRTADEWNGSTLKWNSPGQGFDDGWYKPEPKVPTLVLHAYTSIFHVKYQPSVLRFPLTKTLPNLSFFPCPRIEPAMANAEHPRQLPTRRRAYKVSTKQSPIWMKCYADTFLEVNFRLFDLQVPEDQGMDVSFV